MQGRVDKISGSVGAGRWSQVHEFEKDGLRLIAAVSLESVGLGETQTITLGREILARLHELIFADGTEEILPKIKSCLQVMGSEFVGISVSLAVLRSNVVYVGAHLGGVWVKRAKGEGFVIAAGLSGTASSHFLPGDVIILGNPDFFTVLPEGSIRPAISSEGGSEQLATMAHASAKGHNIVAAVLSFSHTEDLPTIKEKGFNLWQRFFKGPVYVSYTDKESRRRKTKWIGVGFLVVMLALVAGYQIYKSQTDSRRIEARQKLEEVTQKFTEAKALVPLNRPRSQELLVQVKQALEELSTNKYALADPRYTAAKSGLAQLGDEAAGINRAQAVPLLDLTLVRENSVVSQMALLDKQLLVLDTTANRLFSVDLAKKSPDVLAGYTDLGTTKLLASYPDKVEVLSNKGVVECSVLSTQCSVKIAADPEWGQISGMGMFGGNIYLLSDLTIWRHQAAETGFTEKGDWLAKSEDNSILSSRHSMAIDGFIWVAGNGQIDKYVRGVHENFSVAGLDSPLGQDLMVYTDGDADKLYILDRANARVVSVNKAGQYQKQYINDSLKDTPTFVVDEKGGQLYFGGGGKIMSINL